MEQERRPLNRPELAVNDVPIRDFDPEMVRIANNLRRDPRYSRVDLALDEQGRTVVMATDRTGLGPRPITPAELEIGRRG